MPVTFTALVLALLLIRCAARAWSARSYVASLAVAANMAVSKARSVIEKELTEGQQEELFEWLSPPESNSYKEAPEFILVSFGVKTSKSAVGRWFQKYGIRRRAQAADTVAGEICAALELKGKHSSEDLQEISTIIFTSEAINAGNTKDFIALQRLQLQRDALQLDQAKFKMLEEKEERAQQAKKKIEAAMNQPQRVGGGLSPEALKQIEEAAGLL